MDHDLWWRCKRKIKYHSRYAALKVIEAMKDSGLHTYKCPYASGHYHIGHHRHSRTISDWLSGKADLATTAKKIRDNT